jgi:hypothetical protein
MKQVGDNLTLELIEPAKRGRGRPPSGLPALSAAERQQARRGRLKEAGMGFLTIAVDEELLAALDKFVQFKDETKSQVVERILRDRLLRKR